MNPTLSFLGKRENFDPFLARRIKGKNIEYWSKWVKFSEWDKKNKLAANYRQVFPNEIVLETDLSKEENAKITQEVTMILRKNNYSFSVYFTGNKSYHVHIWFNNLAGFNDIQRTKIKNLFCDNFPAHIKDKIDRSNLTKKNLILIEGAEHIKTGRKKVKMFSFKEDKVNTMPEFMLEKVKQIEEKPIIVPEYIEKIETCAALDYSLNNKLPTGKKTRYEWVSPNLSAYIRNRPDRDELAARYYSVQDKDTKDLDCWDKKPSEFCCSQLREYMNFIGKSSICDSCLLGGDYNG